MATKAYLPTLSTRAGRRENEQHMPLTKIFAALAVSLLSLLLLTFGCAPSASQRRDADTGRATYHDYLVKYGPPTYETRDGNLRMVQWVEQLTFGSQGTIVTRRDIITIWFDENDIMRRWQKTRR